MIKNPPASVGDAGDMGSIPGLGRSPGIENDNPLQYCCLENSMDREAWRARVHWVANNQTQCMHAHIVYLDTPPGGLIPFLLLPLLVTSNPILYSFSLGDNPGGPGSKWTKLVLCGPKIKSPKLQNVICDPGGYNINITGIRRGALKSNFRV